MSSEHRGAPPASVDPVCRYSNRGHRKGADRKPYGSDTWSPIWVNVPTAQGSTTVATFEVASLTPNPALSGRIWSLLGVRPGRYVTPRSWRRGGWAAHCTCRSIPVYPGQTNQRRHSHYHREVNPRISGASTTHEVESENDYGQSPHTRGKPILAPLQLNESRSIPVNPGQTHWLTNRLA